MRVPSGEMRVVLLDGFASSTSRGMSGVVTAPSEGAAKSARATARARATQEASGVGFMVRDLRRDSGRAEWRDRHHSPGPECSPRQSRAYARAGTGRRRAGLEQRGLVEPPLLARAALERRVAEVAEQ